MSKPLLAMLLISTLTACNLENQQPITVAVYQTTQRCSIDDKPVDCAQVGPYLRDTLKIKAERLIYISFTGSDPGSKEDPILDRIAAEVRTAGFKDVRTARFDLR